MQVLKDFAFAVTGSIFSANMCLGLPFEAGKPPIFRDIGHFSRDEATAPQIVSTRSVQGLKDLDFAVRESIFIANMCLSPPFKPGMPPIFGDIGHLPRDEATARANAQFDWKETTDKHIFKADLPGLKIEEVKIEVANRRVLQISGERKEEEQNNVKWHIIERFHGKFSRQFTLPKNAKVEQAKAEMESGVLTVTVPKQPQHNPEPEVMTIQISDKVKEE